MVGRSTSSTMSAAHTLYKLPKEVYRVGNVGGGHTVDQFKEFLSRIGVRVMTCYDRTPMNARIANNQTFRICIIGLDRDNLLRESNWPTGITIERWDFGRPKPREPFGGRSTTAPSQSEEPAAAASDSNATEATSPVFENCMEQGVGDLAVQSEQVGGRAGVVEAANNGSVN